MEGNNLKSKENISQIDRQYEEHCWKVEVRLIKPEDRVTRLTSLDKRELLGF